VLHLVWYVSSPMCQKIRSYPFGLWVQNRIKTVIQWLLQLGRFMSACTRKNAHYALASRMLMRVWICHWLKHHQSILTFLLGLLFYGLAVKTGSIALPNFFYLQLYTKVCFLGRIFSPNLSQKSNVTRLAFFFWYFCKFLSKIMFTHFFVK